MTEKVIKIIKAISPYASFTEETDLLSEEVLDSMGFLALMVDLEEQFEFELDENEEIYEKLRTVSNIISFLESLWKEVSYEYF